MCFSLKTNRLSYVLSIVFFAIVSLVITSSRISANQGRCTFHDKRMNNTVTMPLPTSLDFCSFAIRGASQGSPIGFGVWGGYKIGVNRAGEIYVINGKKWQYVGMISERPLSDKCVEVNTKACKKWRKNIDRIVNACKRGERIIGLCNDPPLPDLK